MDKNTLDRLRSLAGNEVPVEQPADRSRKNMYEIMESLDEAKAKPDFADIDGDGDKDETAKKAADDKEKMDETNIAEMGGEMARAKMVKGKWTDGTYTQGDPVVVNGQGMNLEWEPEGPVIDGSSQGAWFAVGDDGDEIEFTPGMEDRHDPQYNPMGEERTDEVHYGSEEEWKAKVKDAGDRVRKGLGKKHKKEMSETDQMREWANSVYQAYDDRGDYQEQPDGETVDLSLRRYLNAKAEPVQIEEDHTPEGMLKEYKEFKKDD